MIYQKLSVKILIVVVAIITIFGFSQYIIREQKPETTPMREETVEKIVGDKFTPIEEEAENGLVPIEVVISPEVSKRLQELGWNDDGAREVAKRARASVVCFIERAESDHCSGPAGFVTRGGLIATCGHCTPHVHDDETGETTDLSTFRIKTITGEILEAEVLEKSDKADLALVRVTSNTSALPPPLLLGEPVESEPVIMVGHPSITGNWVITLGKVESVGLDATGKGWTLVDISNAPGNSGSPVLNRNGEVIGVLSGNTYTDDEILFLDPYPLELAFYISLTREHIGVGTAESAILLQDMVNRHQKEWIPETDSKTYIYLEQKVPPLRQEIAQKVTQKSLAEGLQELNWSETEARALAEKVRKSTICLAPPNDLTHCITGWVAAPGIIATCAHCAHSHDGDDALVARTISNTTFSVELLEKSDIADVAIFKVTSNLSAIPPPLALGSASTGDPVLMVGHPSKLGNWVTALGKVTLVEERKEGGYLVDIAWFDGNSGSAVVNRKGEVIGILTGGTWLDSQHPEPYPPHILLDIYKTRTDFATIEDAILFLKPMLEKHR